MNAPYRPVYVFTDRESCPCCEGEGICEWEGLDGSTWSTRCEYRDCTGGMSKTVCATCNQEVPTCEDYCARCLGLTEVEFTIAANGNLQVIA